MVRSLAKRKKTGKLYVRPPRVEAQINEVFSLNPANIRHRLAIGNPQSPEYLSSECLVYLVRDYLRHRNEAIAGKVLQVLLGRCEVILLAKIPDNKLSTAADIREEVLGQFSELFATDGTEENRDDLDYFECRFNQAFSTFYIDRVRSEIVRLERFVPLPDQTGDIQPDIYKEIPARGIEGLQSSDTAESAVLLREIYEAIDALPYDERRAVILHYIMGYQIESKNPNEVTVATLCNVSGRTIHSRLSRAAAKLSIFKEV